MSLRSPPIEGLTEKHPRTADTDSHEDHCQELEETWVENVQTFQIVVRLDGKRKACHQAKHQISESLSPDSTQKEPHLAYTGPTKQQGLITPDPHILKTGETQFKVDISDSTCLNVFDQHEEDAKRGLMLNQCCLEEKYKALEEEDEDEVSSTIFSILLKTRTSVVLKEYDTSMQSACVYGVLIRELDDARQWVRERMADADLLLVQKRKANYNPKDKRRPQLTVEYLLRLKQTALWNEFFQDKHSTQRNHCPKCNKHIPHPGNLDRHVAACQPSCQFCGKGFKSNQYRIKHEKKCCNNESTFNKGSKPNEKVETTLVNTTPLHQAAEWNKMQLNSDRKDRCQYCDQRFKTLRGVLRHESTCIAKKPCDQCGYCYSSRQDFKQHARRHREEAIHKANRYKCRTCNDSFDSRSDLFFHQQQQHGFGEVNLQPVPWIESPFNEDIENDRKAKRVYEANKRFILMPHQQGEITDMFNFPTNDLNGGMQEIERHLEHVFNQQSNAFKLDVSLGAILQHTESGEMKYFVPYSNVSLFEEPMYISTHRDLNHARDKLADADMRRYMERIRPDTKWRPWFITNVLYTATRTEYVLGQGVLPDYIKNKKCIIGLEKVPRYNHTYEDFLCLFRCVSLHKGQILNSQDTYHHYYTWRDYIKRTYNKDLPSKPQDFQGILLEEMSDVEKCFQLAIYVYELGPDDIVTLRHNPRTRFKNTMHLNLFKHHLSYITDISSYAKKFKCPSCYRHFNRCSQFKTHVRTCLARTKFTYKGGIHSPSKTIFEELQEVGITVTPQQCTYPWFCVFDFEAILEKIFEQNSEKLIWTQKHHAVSVSVCSNVEGFTEPRCFVDEDIDKLLASMVLYMNDIQTKSTALAYDLWQPLIIALDEAIQANKQEGRVVGEEEEEEENDEEEIEEEEEEEGQKKKKSEHSLMFKLLKRLKHKLESYCQVLPVIGFNSAKYDLNLIKKHLFKHLNINQEKNNYFVIKKNNSYLSVSNERLKFIDITQFLAPGSSYSAFLKAFNVEEQKFWFPYEYLDSYAKLSENELPSHDAFFSTLKNTNIKADDYEKVKQVWKREKMTTLKDLLMYYNNLDVKPFVKAVERLQTFYFDKGIDLFKLAVSVPGIARRLLFSGLPKDTYFSLIGEKDEDLYLTFKKNIIGGPSIIFHRHHKVGETLIREEKTCRNIVGYDANALYLWSLGQPLPTGSYIRRRSESGFRPEKHTRYLLMYTWMDWLIKTTGVNIGHRLNLGKEIRTGPYLADGFCPESNTVFEDLLEEVIDQKPELETLIREGYAYLDNDRDSLLCYDIAEIHDAWQHLKEKLRKLGAKPWTSRTQLSEINKFFETRNLNTTQQTPPRRRKRPVSLPSSPESFPCSDLSQFSWSTSSEGHAHSLSGISGDLDFSGESLDLESSYSVSPKDQILGSHISLEENYSSRDRVEEEEDLPSRISPTLQNSRFTKEGSSLPILFYTLHSSEAWCRQNTPRQSNGGQENAQSSVYNYDYSCSEEDSRTSLDFTCHSLENLEEGNGLDTDGNFKSGIFCSPDDNARPVAASEDNLILMKTAFPHSLRNILMDPVKPTNGAPRSGRSSPNNGGSGRSSPLGVRVMPPSGDYSPVLQKRRRLNDDVPSDILSTTTSGGSSPRDSPTSLHLMLNPGMSLGSASFDDTFDEFSDSQLSSHGNSPSVHQEEGGSLRRKYRKDELWAAIKSDYNYLMDGEIIETCKSTESDLSWESDDLMSQTKVSFTEFIQQYKELTEWLNHIQQMTQRQSSSLSEKYLNMTYHEEMLQRSPRRKVFNDYAKQLMRRYPGMKDEINIRLQHLNGQWETLEKTISPGSLHRDEKTMLRDLEQDLNGLRKWLHEVESRLLPLCIRPHWTRTQLEEKLKEHQALQRDIESHSKIVSAVLKLCEHLQSDKNACSNDGEKDSLQLVAINLERRWHAIWLQSLEWQCRLEEAITKGTGLHPTPLTEPDDWRGRFSYSKTHTVDINTHYHHHNGNESDEHSSGDEELSELISYDDIDSDTSNYDTIPFSENEYEKIIVDTDCQTEDQGDEDDDNGQLSPGGASASSKGSGCSSGMDPAIDSALGRSVSDHSINNEHHHIACQRAQQKITTDQVNRAVNKVVSFANSAEMRASPEPALAQKTREKTKRMLGKGDHDIGYSSESHSNDEPDFGCQPLAEDQEDGGCASESHIPAEGSPDVSIERPRSLEAVVLRKRNSDGTWDGLQGDSGTGPSPVTPDKSWRHSMTSAYDTSSQCSEANSPYDLDATLETSADVSVCTAVEQCDSAGDERNSSVQDLLSTSNQNFYVMTSVESDVDAAVNKSLDITTGEDPVREGDADEVEDISPSELRGNFTHSTPIKGQESEYIVGEPDMVGSPERLRHDPFQYSVSPSSGLNVLDVLTELEEFDKERSESLCVQVDSESSDREVGFSAEDLSARFVDEVSPAKRPAGNESLKKLIQQAELIVRDGDLAPDVTRFRRRRKHRSKRPHVSIGGTESIPNNNTDTSAMPTTEDSHVSSCDASSECTDTEGEYSTESSEEESGNTSAILASQGLSGNLGFGPGKFKSNTLPRAKSSSKRRDHNCSVTELYELSNRLDLSPFSTSEGAIDYLPSSRYATHTGSSNQNLRRTTSEMSSLKRSEAPVRAKKRRLRRSASDETEEKTLSAGSINQSHRMSVSMPNSRQQSSQEWQSLSSPDQCPSRDTLQKEWLAACQEQEAKQKLTETSDVSDSDIAEKCRNTQDSDIDTEDPMLKSMNSTMESFSENAWDNYQGPLYQVNSDDPTEEKLDDSALQWDQNLEFEEDFRSDCAFGSGLKGRSGADNKVRHRDKRIPTSNSFHEMSHVDDSDSDLEDLHHVIEESRQQITVAESVLNKHHKDVFDTGLYMDASKYTELVATCQTNIKCMDVLTETIDSGESSINITEEDMQQVKDIVDKWEDLHHKATERQQQARELGSMYKELSAVSTSVNDIVDELDLMSCFEDVHDLEYCTMELQTRKMESHQHKSRLCALAASVQRFAQQNPDVHMARFSEETQQLTSKQETVTERCDQQVSKMQSVLFSWYDFNETHKEMSYLVGRERRELQCLALTHDILAVSLPDAVDTIHDLKIMKSEFESYENKMWSLRTLSADILPVCVERSQTEVRQIVSWMESELSDVSRACDDLVAALEEKVIKQGGSVLLYPQSVSTDRRYVDVDALDMKPEEELGNGERQSLMWRIFKIAIPLHLALIVLLGLAYILDPDTLASFGVVFSPQLRYVRGPPPV